MNDAVKEMLNRYKANSVEEYEDALKEILQEIILLGLDRGGFFEHAAFYGGTALRILHKLNRFSEDIDFTLLKSEPQFIFDKYFPIIERELKAYGFSVKLERVQKSEERKVESAFLKTNTQLLFLKIEGAEQFARNIQKEQTLKIKFEADVDPVTSFETEIKTIHLPSPFTVRALTLPCLFAGKMHAALLRKWKNRIKGRDFFDVQWYLSRNIPLKKIYLEDKMKESGALNTPLTKELLIDLFKKRVDSIDWDQAKNDVLTHIQDKSLVNLWSPQFFKEMIENISLA